MRWQMKDDPANPGKQIVDQDSVNELVDYAYKHGVNYFDTSPAYLQGQSEKAAGIALSRYPRNTYYIATKLSNFNITDHDGTVKMYHDSFDQLQTDYFDYYLLHGIGMGGWDAFQTRYVDNGIMDFLLKEREAGRIRNLGFSFHGNQESFDKFLGLYDKYHWDFVQIEMNYKDWKHADNRRNVNADYLYDQLDKLELPITVMEPLLGGRLSNPPESIANQLKEREPDRSVASWAFRFVGTYPRVLTALSGMTYMEHLQDNIETFTHFKPLTEEELEFLEKMATILTSFPTVNCTNCKYCMPCPYGIDIPSVFQHYNRMVNEGAIVHSKDESNFRKLRRKYLISFDEAVPPERQGNHCIGCRQCVPHCPQSINIPHELHRIAAYVEKLKKRDFE
jgi:predicted aldo/keto reductase-like oxidoreductase